MAIFFVQEYEFYYLQSRYYDPEVGRFLNADELVSTGQGILGNNMLAYCQNNPITFIDPDGLCRVVGALLTWVDCGKWSCPTSSWREPTRYYNDDNRPKHKYYVRYHQFEQERKMLEEEVAMEQAKIVISIYKSDNFSKLSATGKMASGGKSIIAGVGLLLLPDPTPANDLLGVRKITFGIVNVAVGFAKLIKEHKK